MTVPHDQLRPLRYLCADCGSDLGVVPAYGPPATTQDCQACGALCALTGPGRSSRVSEALPAVKVVPTGLGAVARLI